MWRVACRQRYWLWPFMQLLDEARITWIELPLLFSLPPKHNITQTPIFTKCYNTDKSLVIDNFSAKCEYRLRKQRALNLTLMAAFSHIPSICGSSFFLFYSSGCSKLLFKHTVHALEQFVTLMNEAFWVATQMDHLQS